MNAKERLLAGVPDFVPSGHAWYGMRAILLTCQATGKPKKFVVDLAQDFALLHRYSPDRFVFCLREYGTDVFLPSFLLGGNTFLSGANTFNSMYTVGRTFGNECSWYTFDITDVRNDDSYNEPQLRPCTLEQAVDFLRNIS